MTSAIVNKTWRAWLVDLDGTLYHPKPVQLAMGLELALFGWSALPVIRAFRRAHEVVRHETLSERGGLAPYQRQLTLAAEQCQRNRDEVAALVETWMIRRPGRWLKMWRRESLIAEVQAFRQQGGRTALVSDYPAQLKLHALGLDDFFDVVVANGESAQVGALKPDPAGYLAAAQALGLSPGECLVIGDRDDADGQAASAAGMGFRKIR